MNDVERWLARWGRRFPGKTGRRDGVIAAALAAVVATALLILLAAPPSQAAPEMQAQPAIDWSIDQITASSARAAFAATGSGELNRVACVMLTRKGHNTVLQSTAFSPPHTLNEKRYTTFSSLTASTGYDLIIRTSNGTWGASDCTNVVGESFFTLPAYSGVTATFTTLAAPTPTNTPIPPTPTNTPIPPTPGPCQGSISGGGGSLESGQTRDLTLSISSGTLVGNVIWTGGVLSNQTNSGVTVTAPSTGSGTITVRAYVNCGGDSVTISADSISYAPPAATPTPTASPCTGSLSGPGTVLNLGESAAISLSMSAGTASTVSWSTTAGTLSGKSKTGATITAPSSGKGAMRITASITCTGWKSTDSASLWVNFGAPPTATPTPVPTPLPCSGYLTGGGGTMVHGETRTIYITISSGIRSGNVVWSGGTLSNQTNSSAVVTAPSTGSGTITVRAQVNCGGDWTTFSADSITYGQPTPTPTPVPPTPTPTPVPYTMSVEDYGHTLKLTLWTSEHPSWHYKADRAPYTACSGAVDSATATLTGLAPGAEYVFTGYKDSACTMALLGDPSVTFNADYIQVSPAVQTTIAFGTATDYTLTLAGTSGDIFTVTALSGAIVTHSDTDYSAGSAFTHTLATVKDTVVIKAAATDYTGAGFSVKRNADPARVFVRYLSQPPAAPTPTINPTLSYAHRLRAVGGPNEITVTYSGCCQHTYRLELRDVTNQTVLQTKTAVISAGLTDSSYITAPPVYFAGLESGRQYGVCLMARPGKGQTVFSGDAADTLNKWLCVRATTELPTPPPQLPTAAPPTPEARDPTPTHLPGQAPGSLFGPPTPTPPPTSAAAAGPTEPAAPTPTRWTENLLYTDASPQWETPAVVYPQSAGQVKIEVHWTAIDAADVYELWISDGGRPTRLEYTDDAVIRAHAWEAAASNLPSRVRVRAVQVANPFASKVSSAYGRHVVIPSGQQAYSQFSAELLASTSSNTIIEPITQPEPPPDSGGAMRDLGLYATELVGAPPSLAGRMALLIWLGICLLAMVMAMASVAARSGGIIGPWPFVAGSFFFFALWSGVGGYAAGLDDATRFLPLALLSFLAWKIARDRGWIGG